MILAEHASFIPGTSTAKGPGLSAKEPTPEGRPRSFACSVAPYFICKIATKYTAHVLHPRLLPTIEKPTGSEVVKFALHVDFEVGPDGLVGVVLQVAEASKDFFGRSVFFLQRPPLSNFSGPPSLLGQRNTSLGPRIGSTTLARLL